jgi:hypothetical protein
MHFRNGPVRSSGSHTEDAVITGRSKESAEALLRRGEDLRKGLFPICISNLFQSSSLEAEQRRLSQELSSAKSDAAKAVEKSRALEGRIVLLQKDVASNRNSSVEKAAGYRGGRARLKRRGEEEDGGGNADLQGRA